MPETPQQWYARVQDAVERAGYRDPGYQDWPTWPLSGALTSRPLDPPATVEPPRSGAGGADCFVCRAAADPESTTGVLWTDEQFVIALPDGDVSLPLSCFLEPVRHADLAQLTDREAARQGVLLAAVERAAIAVLAVPRIQVLRVGDAVEHLHWWLLARPLGQLQLRGSFLPIWKDLLPSRPFAQVRADHELVIDRLVAEVGGRAVRR